MHAAPKAQKRDQKLHWLGIAAAGLGLILTVLLTPVAWLLLQPRYTARLGSVVFYSNQTPPGVGRPPGILFYQRIDGTYLDVRVGDRWWIAGLLREWQPRPPNKGI